MRLGKRKEGRRRWKGEWIWRWKEKKGGGMEVGHRALQGGKRRGEVGTEEGWDELHTMTAKNGEYAVR